MSDKHAQYLDLRDKLLEDYPEVFGTKDHPQPLAIGIRDSLSALIGPVKANAFLNFWCQRIEYQIALMHGGPRFDSCGMVNGEVLQEQQGVARAKVARYLTRARTNAPEGRRIEGLLGLVEEGPVKERLMKACSRAARKRSQRALRRELAAEQNIEAEPAGLG